MSDRLTAAAIETARAGDIPALLALDIWLTTPERQAAIVRASVATGGCFVAREPAARDGAAIAGFVTWDRGFFDRPFVRLLVVAAAFRRRGLGAALIRHVERTAAPHGELFISTELRNTPMRALLLSLDYTPSGSIDNINPGDNLELIYHKALVGRSRRC